MRGRGVGMWSAMRPRLVMGFLVTMAAVGATVSAPASAQEGVPDAIDLPQELDRVLRDYEVAWRAGDAGALAALFTADGFVLSGARPPARGTEAIRARYAGSQGPLHLEAWDYSIAGDVAFIIGGFGIAEGDRPVGKYVLTLRRVDGRWLIHSDMDGPLG